MFTDPDPATVVTGHKRHRLGPDSQVGKELGFTWTDSLIGEHRLEGSPQVTSWMQPERVSVAVARTSSATDWLHSAPEQTPWGASDSPVVVSQVESALERVLSASIMRGGAKPRIRTLHAGEDLTRQCESRAEVYLVLDGLLRVVVDGRTIGELGPGVVGERSLLEGGVRTATLTATTPAQVAIANSSNLDRNLLQDLTAAHRRENAPQSPHNEGAPQ